VSLNVHSKYNFLILLIMKKQILNIGKALSRAEQKEVFGGNLTYEGDECKDECTTDADCTDPSWPKCITFEMTETCPDSPSVKGCFI
jgi:hypothetical protein